MSNKEKKDNKLLSRMELVSHIKDHSHLEKFSKDICSNYPVRDRKYKNGLSVIEVYNKKFCEGLLKFGCIQCKSLILKFPYMVNKIWYKDIIRGYFDGDGCAHVNNKDIYADKITIVSGSLCFLKSIKEILKSNDITCYNIWSDKRSNANILTIKSSDIEKAYEYFYNGASTYLERKERKFSQIIERRKSIHKTKNLISQI